MEKIIANETTDKRLISKIYKQLVTAQCQKNSLIKQWAEDLNRHFSKDMQRATKWKDAQHH